MFPVSTWTEMTMSFIHNMTLYSRVPVLFGDPVEAGEHDGQDDAGVLLDQTHDVLVVPVVQSSFCNLRHGRRTQTGSVLIYDVIMTTCCFIQKLIKIEMFP